MARTTNTIYDIAAEAGVSITTVSRVIRGERNVSAATREKVEAVIARLNYRPSSIARGMATRKTHTLGIVLPKLLNPNYAMIFTGACDEAHRQGHSISLFPWASLNAQDAHPALMLAERRLDGVIICVEYLPPEQNERLLSALRELRPYMPIVLIGCVPSRFDDPAISYNMSAIVKESVAYLVSLGHERIALIGGVREDEDEFRRDVGYAEGLKEARLPFIASYRVWCDGTAQAGEEALEGILSSLMPSYWPTAVIALNDLVAMGCQAAARKFGLRLPEDMSIMGCDNLFCAPYLTPPLTSIDMHQQRLGKRAVQLLLSGERRREEADWELVIRASCQRASSGTAPSPQDRPCKKGD